MKAEPHGTSLESTPQEIAEAVRLIGKTKKKIDLVPQPWSPWYLWFP